MNTQEVYDTLKEIVLSTGTTGQTETLITHSENKKQTIEMIRRFQDVIDMDIPFDAMVKHKVKEIGLIYAVVAQEELEDAIEGVIVEVAEMATTSMWLTRLRAVASSVIRWSRP